MLTENEGRSKKPSTSIDFFTYIYLFIWMYVCVSLLLFDFFFWIFNLSTRSLLVKIGNDKQIMDHDVIRFDYDKDVATQSNQLHIYLSSVYIQRYAYK